MATMTYSKASAAYADWHVTYDASNTVAKAFAPGWVGYFEQNSDGTSLIVKVHAGQIVSMDWVDWSLPDPVLMHADMAMDPAPFLDALYGFRPSTKKALAALLAGDDDILGSSRADDLVGGGGNDLMRGGAGRDRLNGGAGDDTIEGGAGQDRMTGGAGADLFRFGAGDGPLDTITDFTPGMDRIDLTPTGAALVFGANVVFDAATHRLLVDLDGVAGAELTIALPGVAALTAADLVLG